MNTDNNFQWTDEFVREIVGIAHKDGYESIQKTDLDKLVDRFKQSKLEEQQQIPNNEWEVVELIFWSGEKTKDYLVIQNWLAGDKRYDKWSIHSVKRLSDGEVFTVSDVFWVYPGHNKHTIKSFHIDGAFLAVLAEDFPKYTYYLPHLLKQPIIHQPSSIDRIEVKSIPNKQDERIEVTNITQWNQTDILNGERYLKVNISDYVPRLDEKFPYIKSAIEQAINDKEEKTYTQSEVDTIREERDNYKNCAEKLWNLLDDIDTSSDIRKPTIDNPKSLLGFYNQAMKYAAKRFDILKSDGYNLSLSTTQPKKEDKPIIIEDNDRCGICGGEMVYIRGRYPNTDNRKVCPTCTTERLASKIRPINSNVVVIPNALPFINHGDQFTSTKTTSSITRFGFVGGTSHKGDLMSIAPVFQYFNQLNFSYCGFSPRSKEAIGIQTLCSNVGKNLNYKSVDMAPLDKYMYAYDNLDCCIAPLLPEEFNKYKSNLKVLEAGLKKCALICSPNECYTDTVPAEVVTYCKSVKDWKEAIKKHQDLDYTKNRGEKLHEWVKTNYSLEEVNKQRLQLYESL